MPLLYEATSGYVLIKSRLSRPLTSQEKQALYRRKSLIEEKSHMQILDITVTPREILFYCSPRGFFFIGISAITAISVIAASIGLPITAWFITHPDIPEGPLGLPLYFWVGVGVGIPIFGLALVIWRLKR